MNNTNQITNRKFVQVSAGGFIQARMLRYDRWVQHNKLKVVPYQRKAVQWMLERELRNEGTIKGGILADEMGMGKTYSTLGTMMANPTKGMTLIVVPPALLDQWVKIINKFICNDEGSVIVYHGPKVRNLTITQERLTAIGTKVVLTTYGMITVRRPRRNQTPHECPLWNINWYRTIYDEAHHMRNSRGLHWSAAKHKTNCQVRWLLTGTPLQNYKNDVHALIELIDHTRSLKDLCLHRSKNDVGLKLPNIQYKNCYVTPQVMNDSEISLLRQLHSALPFSNITIDNVDEYMAMFEGKGILPLLTATRQACIYPSLLVDRMYKLRMNGTLDYDFVPPVVTDHSKLTTIVNTVLSQPKKEQKIIFTHFHGESDRLHYLLSNKGYNVGKIDGRTKNKDRQNLLQGDKQFNQLLLNRLFNGKHYDVRNKISEYLGIPDILLLQIKSCCEGLNLQQYNQIYFTSPHWNPAVEDQAIARAHRIGQKKSVKVFKFITKLLHDDVADIKSVDQYASIIQQIKREKMREVKIASTNQL